MTATSSGYTRPAGPRPKLPAVLVLAKAQAFANSLARRRLVREFSNRPVPAGVIEAAVRAGATAWLDGDQVPCAFVAVSDVATRRRLKDLAPAAESAPVVLVVFERGDGAGRMVHEAVGVGVGFLMTTLHHAGLTAVPQPVRPSPELNELLRRPADEDAYMVISVGYPTNDTAPAKLTKRPLDGILYWH